MTDLSTRYMGLSLSNPLIVSSSGLTSSLKGAKLWADAGAGALVLKSLFEEQIVAEAGHLSQFAELSGHAEAAEYLQGYGMALGPREYLRLVEEAKKSVAIPVIASLNCYSDHHWMEYALQLESAGADGLELNVALMSSLAGLDGVATEERYFNILAKVKSRLRIPVALKIGPWFSSFAHFAHRLGHDRVEGPDFSVGWCGPGKNDAKPVWKKADALVLFNRYYQFDIDIDKLQTLGGSPFSSPAEIHTSLRWISLLAGRIESDLAASTGVHGSAEMIKALLAGASAVQVCSTLYKNGTGQIALMLEELRRWMEGQGFESIAAFRGLLSQMRSKNPASHERMQYIKQLGFAP